MQDKSIPDSRFQILDSRRGFTILELLIFTAIFTGAAMAFIAILVAVTRVHVRQNAMAEVTQQSQFLLTTIQRYVEQSSAIEMANDSTTSTLKLRMASTTGDPAYIYLSGTTVYLKQTESGTAEPLTSDKVQITSLNFAKRSNPGGHDSVSVAFLMNYNATNIQHRFTNEIDTAIGRVSAATFDSNILPSTGNTYRLGTAAADWQAINNTIYFSGSNVGVGVASPGQTLEVNGGVRLNTTTGKPTCDSTQRGTLWVTQSASGTKDYVQACIRSSTSTFYWATLD